MEYKVNRSLTNRNPFAKIINSTLIFVLVFSIVFFPSDSLNSKILSFGLLLILNSKLLINKLLKKENSILLFFGVVFPLVLIMISTMVNNFNFVTAISNAYIMTYLLLVIIINHYDIKYERMFIFALSCLSILITLSGALDIFGIVSINNNPLLEFFRIRNEARVGYWPTTTFGYVLFFKASPLLVALVGYSYMKKNYFLLLITLVAMGFTGTRANLYAAFIVIIIYFLLYRRTTIIKVLMSLLVSFGLIFILPYVFDFILDSSVKKMSTDLVKYNHFLSIMNFLADNPMYIFTGSGLGSYFFSTGIMDYTNLTELAFLDLFRQIGIIGFIPFMFFLVYPFKYLLRELEYQWLGVSYIGYLMIAFTNPLLFSSTPFALYVLVYSVYMKRKMLDSKIQLGKEK